MMNYPFIICFFLGFLFGSLGLLVLSLIITAKNNINFDEYDDALQQKSWEESELSVTSVSPVSEQPNNTDNNNNI